MLMYIREESESGDGGVVSCIVTEGWVHESGESCSKIMQIKTKT